MGDPIDTLIDHVDPGVLRLLRPREIAEIVWLRTQLGGAIPAGPAGDARARGEARRPPVAQEAPSEARDGEPRVSQADQDDGSGSDEESRVELEPAPADAPARGGSVGRGGSHEVGGSMGVNVEGQGEGDMVGASRAVAARVVRTQLEGRERLSNALRYARALHRLSRTRPTRDRIVVDAEGTVRDTAAAGQLCLRLRELSAPCTHALWLFDSGVQLAPWRPMLRELAAAVLGLGSFASVTFAEVDLRGPKPVLHGLDERLAVSGEVRDIGQLMRPGDESLVLLVSDGLGKGAWEGGLAGLLRRLPRGTRAAWVHPWPEVRWWYSPAGRRAARAGARDGPVVGDQAFVLPMVPLTAAGLSRLQAFAQGRGSRGLARVRVPGAGELRASPGGAVIVPGADVTLARILRTVEGATARLLVRVACVPGWLDMSLLQSLCGHLVPGGNRFTMGEALASGALETVQRGRDPAVRVVESLRSHLLAGVAPAELREVYTFLRDRYLNSATPERALERAEALRIPIRLVDRALSFTSSDLVPDAVIQHECGLEGARILASTLVSANAKFELRYLARTAGEARARGEGVVFVSGSRLDGTVVSATSYGAFVAVPGGRGLLRRGSIRPGDVPPADRLFAAGDVIPVTVNAADEGPDRLEFGLELAPAQQAAIRDYPVGSALVAVVEGDPDAVPLRGRADRVAVELVGFDHLPAATRQAGERLHGVVVAHHLATGGVVVEPYRPEAAEIVEARVTRVGKSIDHVELEDGSPARLVANQRAWPVAVGDHLLVSVTGSSPTGALLVSERVAASVLAAEAGGLAVGSRVSGIVRGPIGEGWLVDCDGVRGIVPHELWSAGGLPGMVSVVVAWVDVPRQRRFLVPGDLVPVEEPGPRPSAGDEGVAHVLGASSVGLVAQFRGHLALVPQERASWDRAWPQPWRFPPGARVRAVVSSYAQDTGCLELDLRQGASSPWLEGRFEAGAAISATVVHVEEDRVIVNADDICVAIHATQTADNTRDDLRTAYRLGQVLAVRVSEYAPEARKLKLVEVREATEAAPPADAIEVGRVVTTRGPDFCVVELAGGLRARLAPGERDKFPGAQELGASLEVECTTPRVRGATIVSAVRALESRRHARLAWLLENLAEGLEVVGTVKNVVDYGAFIDLGGLDGLLHASEMGWGRQPPPREVFEAGQVVTAKVLKWNPEFRRLHLSIKAMEPDPWEAAVASVSVGDIVEGTVTSLVDYGAFVDLTAGGQGLVHSSEASWADKGKFPPPGMAVGSSVRAKVLEVDHAQRRFSLSARALQVNPWEALAGELHPRDRLTGRVRNITDFGVFIEVREGIDGLVHISDMAWTPPAHPSDRVAKGDVVDVEVIAINAVDKKLTLSMKACTADPWPRILETVRVGDLLSGTIATVTEFGCFVDLEEGVQGLCHRTELALPAEFASGAYRRGAPIRVAVLGVDGAARKLSLTERSWVRGLPGEREALVRSAQIGDGVICVALAGGEWVRIARPELGPLWWLAVGAPIPEGARLYFQCDRAEGTLSQCQLDLGPGIADADGQRVAGGAGDPSPVDDAGPDTVRRPRAPDLAEVTVLGWTAAGPVGLTAEGSRTLTPWLEIDASDAGNWRVGSRHPVRVVEAVSSAEAIVCSARPAALSPEREFALIAGRFTFRGPYDSGASSDIEQYVSLFYQECGHGPVADLGSLELLFACLRLGPGTRAHARARVAAEGQQVVGRRCIAAWLSAGAATRDLVLEVAPTTVLRLAKRLGLKASKLLLIAYSTLGRSVSWTTPLTPAEEDELAISASLLPSPFRERATRLLARRESVATAAPEGLGAWTCKWVPGVATRDAKRSATARLHGLGLDMERAGHLALAMVGKPLAELTSADVDALVARTVDHQVERSWMGLDPVGVEPFPLAVGNRADIAFGIISVLAPHMQGLPACAILPIVAGQMGIPSADVEVVLRIICHRVPILQLIDGGLGWTLAGAPPG